MEVWIVKAFLKIVLKLFTSLLKTAICLACVVVVLYGVVVLAVSSGEREESTKSNPVNYAIMDRYDMFVTNTLSNALDGVLSIKKVYWLSDDDLVAPEPDQNCYGESDDPTSLQWLLEDAEELLEGQNTVFSTDREIVPGSKVLYYLDETIMVITWKELRDELVYTISEVKICDPSQFRRFLADGEFASGRQYVATQMAESVNAVVAANGDFYSFRDMGIIVQDSQLMRMEGYCMDTCFIDGNGDLQFAYTGEMTDRAETEQYLKDNGVRFSVAFGPVLIDNCELRPLASHYPVGEGEARYARAALCQMDTLHYLLVAVSSEPPYDQYNGHTMSVFAENLLELGCKKAYNLDGGQSATIVMNDQKVNYVWLRKISDIIYFATAIPNSN